MTSAETPVPPGSVVPATSVKLPTDEQARAVKLFNGRDTDGWEGHLDPYWSVESGEIVARGFRNPMYLNCLPWGACYAAELSGDGWDSIGGREKLVELHDGDDYGYPCCVDRGMVVPGTPPGTEVPAEPHECAVRRWSGPQGHPAPGSPGRALTKGPA